VTVGFQVAQVGQYAPPINVVLNGEAVAGGGTVTPGGSGGTTTGGTGGGTTGGGTGGGTTGGGSTGGTVGGGGTVGTGGPGGSSAQEFSPYIDMTLWPAPNYTELADAGVTDATLAFVVSGTGGQPAWGGVYSLTDPYITAQVAQMQSLGIDPTVSFGGASGIDLAYTAPDAATLADHYTSVVDNFGIRQFDFDVEGGMQGNIPVLTRQAQAIALLQSQQAAAGTPVEVSYTLPVLPTGLTPEGLQVLQIANDNGVTISRVNLMTMDYGEIAHPNGNSDMGDLAIMAATSTHGQLMTMYPQLTSEQAWSMIGVTPMIGINDVQSEVFTLSDAHQILDFADQNNLGEIGMWSVARDSTGTLGVVGPHGSGIQQNPYDYSKIFAQFDD
jgi:hypothetical protein